MFNNLGSFSHRRMPIRRVIRRQPVYQIGQIGNDIFYNSGSGQGATGFTGSQGATGFTGSQGATGFTGSQGAAGFTGSQGAIGFTGSQGAIGFTGSQGAAGFTGSSGVLGVVPVTVVTTTTYNAVLTDYDIAVNVAGPSSVIFPVSPTGTVFIVKDASGLASGNPITITASTTIDGSANATINTNYGSLTFVFNGTEWNIV